MGLKREHAAAGLTRARLQRQFGFIPVDSTARNISLPHSPDSQVDKHDDTAEETSEVDILCEDQESLSFVQLAAKLCQDVIDDEFEDQVDANEANNATEWGTALEKTSSKRIQSFFGTKNPILLKDLFDYNSSHATGHGLDCFRLGGIANLQKELEIYDLVTRDAACSIMYSEPVI